MNKQAELMKELNEEKLKLIEEKLKNEKLTK